MVGCGDENTTPSTEPTAPVNNTPTAVLTDNPDTVPTEKPAATATNTPVPTATYTPMPTNSPTLSPTPTATNTPTPTMAQTVNDDKQGIVYNLNHDGKTYTADISQASGNIEIADDINGYYVTVIIGSEKNNKGAITGIKFPKNLTEIGNYAFYKSSGLTSITIPEGVTTLGTLSFAGLTELGSLTFPSTLTTIGEMAFSGCAHLANVTIPNSVTTISGGAFTSCASFTEIVIPDKVTTLGGNAFGFCYNLTSLTIPESVNNIGTLLFMECNKIEKVYVVEGSFADKYIKDNYPKILRYTIGTNKLLDASETRPLTVGDKLEIDKKYTAVSHMAGGVIIVEIDNACGAIDINGNEIVSCTYTGSTWKMPTNSGYFLLSDADGVRYVFDKNGKIIASGKDISGVFEHFYSRVTVGSFEDPSRIFPSDDMPSESLIYEGLYDPMGSMYTNKKIEYYNYENKLVLSTYGGYSDYKNDLGENEDGLLTVYNEFEDDSFDRDAYERFLKNKYNLGDEYKVHAYRPIRACIGLMDKDGNVAWTQLYVGPKYLWITGPDGYEKAEICPIYAPVSGLNYGYYACYSGEDPQLEPRLLVRFFDQNGKMVKKEQGYFSYNNTMEDTYIQKYFTGNSYCLNRGDRIVMAVKEADFDEVKDSIIYVTKSYRLLDIINDKILLECDGIYLGDSDNILIQKDGKWGYCDVNGNILQMYDDAGKFSNGYAPIIVEGLVSIVNEKFELVTTLGNAVSVSTYGDMIRINRGNGIYEYYYCK